MNRENEPLKKSSPGVIASEAKQSHEIATAPSGPRNDFFRGSEKAVIVNNLVVAFGDFKAVKDVSFEVDPGEIFGFLGANGAGKTTTIRVLCGLLPPTAGKVQVAGADPDVDVMAVKSRVGYMSQKFTLYRDMTIDENLRFTAKLRRLSEERISSRIKELMEFIELEWPLTTMVKDLPVE